MEVKRRYLILGGVLLAAALGWLLREWPHHAVRQAVDTARRDLHQKGFRSDTAELKQKQSVENLARGRILLTSGLEPSDAFRTTATDFRLMWKMNSNAALSVVQLEFFPSQYSPGTNLWEIVKRALGTNEAVCDQAIAEVIRGPIEFPVALKPDHELDERHLAQVKSFVNMLGYRAALAMYEHNTNRVLANLSAQSHVAIAWRPEPVEISHLVRAACVFITWNALWESMQTDFWDEQHLVAEQRKWEAARFFDQLPEVAEGNCAMMIAMCRAELTNKNDLDWNAAFRELVNSPKAGSKNLSTLLKEQRKQARYQEHDSYEDEVTLLQYYAERYQQLKQAISSPTWAEMRSLPGITNAPPFPKLKISHVRPLSSPRQELFMARMAETEALRRMIITAVALERFTLRHKSYPASLKELVPEFLPSVPTDFMDGKELRYRRRADGRYLLYSTGRDCVDDDGQSRNSTFAEPDLIWPLPATQADVDAYSKNRYY